MEHLIPDAWFSAIGSQWLLFLVAAIAIAVLGKGADWVVDGAANAAYRMGISKMIVGATIVSLGTTSPEAAVSVMAAWGGKPDLALGNAVGSIICDTALIFGLSCALTRLPVDRFILNRQGWLQFASGMLLILVCVLPLAWDADPPMVTRNVGFFFLALLGAYLWISVRWSRQHGKAHAHARPETEAVDLLPKTHSLARDLGWLLIGLFFVLLSSRVLIGSVTELAIRWEIPKAVIAATLVAFGTSLPELVTAITAIRKKHTDLLIGNVIGADILNVLFVAGASAAAAPLPVPGIFYELHLPFLAFVLILFRIFISMSKNKFEKWMGYPLLASYVFYVIIQYRSS